MRQNTFRVAAFAALAAVAGSLVGGAEPLRVAFAIEPQPLRGALQAFAKQAGMQVVRRDEDVPVEGVVAPRVEGKLSATEALDRLLSNTEYTYEWIDARTVRIARDLGARNPMAVAPPPQQEERRTQEPGRPLALAQSRPREIQAAAGTNTKTSGQTEQRIALGARDDIAGEVVVTGTHIQGASPASPLIVLGRDDLVRSGRSSIGEVLQILPANFSGGKNPSVLGATGVQNQSNAGYASSPNLRSLGPSSTLTLVNGYRMASSGFGGGVDISAIPVSAIERVEVITDGASAIYGSDAIGGVVNAILRKNFSGFETSLLYGDSTQGGGYEQRANQLAGANWNSGNVMLDYEYSKQDFLYSTDREFSSQAQVPTALVPRLKAHNVILSAEQELSSSSSVSLLGYYTSRSARQPFGTSGLVFNEDVDVQQYGSTGALHFVLPRGWTLSPAATFAKDEVDQVQTDSAAATGAISAITRIGYTNELKAGQLDLEGPVLELPSGKLRLAAGLAYREQTYAQANPAALTSSFESSRNTKALYAELHVPLLRPSELRVGTNRLDLSLAARYEDYEEFGSTTNPKVGLLYQPAKDWTLQGTWGTSFKAPELDQEFIPPSGVVRSLVDPTAVGGRTTTLVVTNGNRNLEPEKARTWTATIGFVPEQVPGLSLRATYFDIEFHDRIVRPIPNVNTALADAAFSPLVVRNPSPAQVQAARDSLANLIVIGPPFNANNVHAIVTNWYQNVGLTEARGFDFSIALKRDIAIGHLTFNADASRLELEQQLFSGLPVQELDGQIFNPPTWKARVGATWANRGFTSALFVNYLGKELDPVSVPPRRIPSWTTADLQLAYTFGRAAGLLSGCDMRVSAINVLDKDPPALAATSTLYPGIGYDSTNASPVGRFVRLQFVKTWATP
jgi:iron complex outermembrane receptor protein